MKKNISIMLLSALALTGCFNREDVRYSDNWPPLADSITLHDFAGRYPNTGEGAGDRLWNHLTKDDHSTHDAQVVISVPDQTLLRAQLIAGTNVLKTVEMELDKDFILKRDHLRLPTEKGFERGALGSGGGYEKFYLYRTVNGSLAGKRKGFAVGLCLHVIPTVGFGTKWTHWSRIGPHNQTLHGTADNHADASASGP